MNNFSDWYFDMLMKQWITAYYWPYFLMGNADDWLKLGVTLNGMRPIRC